MLNMQDDFVYPHDHECVLGFVLAGRWVVRRESKRRAWCFCRRTPHPLLGLRGFSPLRCTSTHEPRMI